MQHPAAAPPQRRQSVWQQQGLQVASSRVAAAPPCSIRPALTRHTSQAPQTAAASACLCPPWRQRRAPPLGLTRFLGWDHEPAAAAGAGRRLSSGGGGGGTTSSGLLSCRMRGPARPGLLLGGRAAGQRPQQRSAPVKRAPAGAVAHSACTGGSRVSTRDGGRRQGGCTRRCKAFRVWTSSWAPVTCCVHHRRGGDRGCRRLARPQRRKRVAQSRVDSGAKVPPQLRRPAASPSISSICTALHACRTSSRSSAAALCSATRTHSSPLGLRQPLAPSQWGTRSSSTSRRRRSSRRAARHRATAAASRRQRRATAAPGTRAPSRCARGLRGLSAACS